VSDLTELVGNYLEIWNEPDADARRRAIAEVWAEDGTYTDPLAAVQGHEAIAGMITAVSDQSPGLVFKLISSVDTHHNLARFTWELTPAAGGESVAIGFDVAVVDQDGRLHDVYGFLDKVPSA
jgi:hypothetical protein